MEIVYTFGKRLGSGIGYTALKTVDIIRKSGNLRQLITGDEIVIESNDSILHNNTFDALASMNIKEPIDILHSWGHMMYSCIIKAHSLGAKTLVERASSHINNQNRILIEEYKNFSIEGNPINPLVIKKQLLEYKETDFVTVPSQFAYDSFIDEGYSEEKLILNSYGVDILKFKPMNVEKYDKFSVLFLGENWLRKGIYYLLKVWNELNLKNAELLVRSNVPFFRNIDYKFIKYIGWVDDIVELYNKVNVFCLPTLEEGNVLVAGEAAACGIPSILTPNAGTWLDDKSCFFVPIRDVKTLKEKLQYCYDNPNELKKIGQNARNLAEKNTWDDYGKRLIKNYERIASN
jgi:glycosyltransferase involved in cell wall biosynthesis